MKKNDVAIYLLLSIFILSKIFVVFLYFSMMDLLKETDYATGPYHVYQVINQVVYFGLSAIFIMGLWLKKRIFFVLFPVLFAINLIIFIIYRISAYQSVYDVVLFSIFLILINLCKPNSWVGK